VAAVIVVAAAFMLRYNHAVTGRATQFPYLVYHDEYGRGPDFVWQKRRDLPLSSDTLMRQYQQWELASADSLRSPLNSIPMWRLLRSGLRDQLREAAFMKCPPNPRLPRTRSAPLRSPLSRKPLGDTGITARPRA
jgi:hypothetical protein